MDRVVTEFWPVELVDGTAVSVEPSLMTVSSYVLIEQEDWFEKETALLRRLLQPGMTVVDIGANIGVYTLVMARVVGPAGQVLAIEPLGGPRAHIERGIGLNGLSNVRILPVAVADQAGSGRMRLGAGAEVASLQAGGGTGGEEVEVTTLDHLAHSLAAPPDFIKIDAEGAEQRILAGGRQVLTRHSPLLMVEIRSELDVNEALLKALQALGYALYRALPAAQGLVPYEAGAPLDRYELNVFACKPDRAEELARRELLVRGGGEWRTADAVPADASPAGTLAALRSRLPFSAGFPAPFASAGLRPDGYDEVLAAWLVWAAGEASLSRRYAALRHAYNLMADILPAAPSLARLLTMMRLASEAGQRSVAIEVAKRLFDLLNRPDCRPDEVFLPPGPRYDAVIPTGDLRSWLLAASGEPYDQLRLFSSCSAEPWPGLGAICATGYASTEMFRRLALRALVDGTATGVDGRLLQAGADHRNAALWRQLLTEPRGLPG